MVDFSNLQKLHVTEETLAEYVFEDIPGEPSVWMAPATDANPAWQSERLRVAIERAEAAEKEPKPRGSSRRQVLTQEDIERERELDRTLFARCCAKRWGVAPQDVNGDTPEFSEANCYAFFKALPNYLFDPLRGFAGNVYNFVPRAPVSQADAANLGNG